MMKFKKSEVRLLSGNTRLNKSVAAVRCAFTMTALPSLMRGWMTMANRQRCRYITPAASARGNAQRACISTGLTEHEKRIEKTMGEIREAPVVLCVREDDATSAYRAAAAAIDGGLRCIEMTLTTPDATSIIRNLQADHPHAVVGAGTVLTMEDVEAVADAGAAFAMSPATDASIIRSAHRHGMLAIPGAATATEVWRAYYYAGARIVKIFPVAFCGGLGFVRALQGPLPQVPLLPTSGVPTEQAPDFLRESNVFAVGVSRQIITREAVKACDWDLITQRARVWADIATRKNIS